MAGSKSLLRAIPFFFVLEFINKKPRISNSFLKLLLLSLCFFYCFVFFFASCFFFLSFLFFILSKHLAFLLSASIYMYEEGQVKRVSVRHANENVIVFRLSSLRAYRFFFFKVLLFFFPILFLQLFSSLFLSFEIPLFAC